MPSLERGQTSREKDSRQEMINAPGRSSNLLTISYQRNHVSVNFYPDSFPVTRNYEIDHWNSELAYSRKPIYGELRIHFRAVFI